MRVDESIILKRRTVTEKRKEKYMQVNKHSVVTIHYTLKDDEGNLMESSEGRDPMAYLHGEHNIIAGLETALEGKSVGDDVSVRIPPEEAYGVRDEEKTQTVPMEMFEGQEVKPGARFHAQAPDGSQITVTVLDVGDEGVIIDANHPLAGMHLNFDVKVVDIRDATEEEISHGHVHGPEGHDH
jgi:FKBP-type peptidyl-prolyl cis-trans isomerase SlyD